MQFTQDGDGPAVETSLADWLCGPGVPLLDRLTRVTLEEHAGDVPPLEVPPAIARAIRARQSGVDPTGVGVSLACLTWAREQPHQHQRPPATHLWLTPSPRRGAVTLSGPARSG